jgi:hypothetical protein
MVKHPNVRFALIALCLIAFPREAEAPPLLFNHPSSWELPPSLMPDGAGRCLAETLPLPPELCLVTDVLMSIA